MGVLKDIIQLLNDVMPYAIMYTVPLLLAALGGLVSERSGVVNIALEGMMTFGAFVCSYFIYVNFATMGYSAVWIGIFLAGFCTALYSLLHAYASVTLNANQVISGTALNMIAPAVTVFLARLWTGTQNINIPQSVKRNNVPVLSDIPVIGPMFFNNYYATTTLVIVITICVWYFVFKTKAGLRLRACGENPHAADSMGINVKRTRYLGVVMSGFLAGLGGGIYIATISGEFNGSVAGLGFLGLAALIFGKWNTWTVVAASCFFGFMKTLGEVARVNETLRSIQLPMEFYNALPYVVTIIALVIFSRNIVGPKAAGEPYDKGKR